MQPELSQLRSFLKDELERKKSFKPLYSLRAFARDTGISLTSLNSFLSGKRDLNLKNVDKVFKYLQKRPSLTCSWCGASKQSAKRLIGGPKALVICEDCVGICNEILRENKQMPKAKN